MQRFVKRVRAALRQLVGSGPPPTRPRFALLNLEAMEQRVVLSASVGSVAAGTASLATPVIAAKSTAGTSDPVANPDAVYGYKHRRHYPRVEAAVTETASLHQDTVFLHLAAGGADGSTTSTGSQLVVQPPEGPLPTDTPAQNQV